MNGNANEQLCTGIGLLVSVGLVLHIRTDFSELVCNAVCHACVRCV